MSHEHDRSRGRTVSVWRVRFAAVDWAWRNLSGASEAVVDTAVVG